MRGSDPGLRSHNDAPEAHCDTEPRPNTKWGRNFVLGGREGASEAVWPNWYKATPAGVPLGEYAPNARLQIVQ